VARPHAASEHEAASAFTRFLRVFDILTNLIVETSKMPVIAQHVAPMIRLRASINSVAGNKPAGRHAASGSRVPHRFLLTSA
jgi:hypothetical protein